MNQDELISLKRSLQQQLPQDGIKKVLAALKKILSEKTGKFNLVFQFEARLNSINYDKLSGILSQEELEQANNRLNTDLLEFIESLVAADFDPASAGPGTDHKTGAVLYQIPHTMRVAEEVRCVVRLAFEDDVIVENIDLTKDTVRKPVRVSEVMEVELTDPNESPAFAIRRMNSVEQFLEERSYTEWLFFVKPLRTGELPLMLVVAVKELINNRERKREIVLEELIHVVTEDTEAVENTVDFQRAGYSFVYTTVATQDNAGFGWPSVLRNKVATLVIVFAVIAGIWAAGSLLGWFKPNPPSPPKALPPSAAQVDSSDWRQALAMGTDSSFYDYLLKHPEGIFQAEAQAKLNSLRALQDSVLDVKENPGRSTSKKPKPQQDSSDGRKSGFTMVEVTGGDYMMGEKGDCPHKVHVNAFRIGKYEVTKTDWEKIMKRRPKSFHVWCPECPVENISWDEVQVFLLEAAKQTGKKYRLPSEAEWEYAARGAGRSKEYKFAGSNDYSSVAQSGLQSSMEVGTKNPNEIGLFDMNGNVQEWCSDIWGPYPNCKGKKEKNKRSVRGGSWYDDKESETTVFSRAGVKKGTKNPRTGFRLVQPY